ncbi:MAG: SDR family NAD(P)-dependent oxidoreductase [Hyphomicrobium sp.]|jgi:short-subunit dehydrogenase|uniref:SDR family NAD(P)-dependent oxidoreductase n=1 Tax=Hyphomicrobium sp. TaxID=82 RepID=UPI0025C3DDCE|nr:SDR family NAD(P)-dependent oxidoreductase [Hyphomicrobium sp.]MBX9863305.1 SDR family NAD(P)-dependent oxidoreductase [Hyphomicrobium sp.]
MTQKSILITGASSGIGLASARLLRAKGWRVLATARTEADLTMLQRDAGVEALHLELADPRSVAWCASEALRLTDGKLTALFNNAAYGQVGAVEDLDPAVLRQQFEVNLFGTHDLTRRVMPAMRANGHGRIVQCSSVLGIVSVPYRGAYCASKFALEALSDAMRHELRGTDIHVSIIEPGPIRTRFVERALATFRATVDIENSAHRTTYLARLAAMEQGGKSTFKLEPEAVAWKLVHAVESPRPKRRYAVTIPTYIAAVSKRVLPASLADWIAQRI